jgi:dolichol-phosphate mannosyltransferase
MQRPEISIVTPIYKSEHSIEEFTERVLKSLHTITRNYEIIFVNDASPDNSWKIIERLSQNNPQIKGIALSRNFGQHPAILCGLQHCQGEVAIVIDCDLQEDPAYIPELYDKYKKGYDIVYTFKKNRKHKLWKNIAVKTYTYIYNYLIDNKTLTNHEAVGSYSLITRKVIDEFVKFKDCQFHYLIILRWLGFKSTFIEIEHLDRRYGKSAYNFKKLLEHALVAIVFQSDKLLRLNIYIGFITALISFILGLIIILLYFVKGFAPGWPSLFVLILFATGTILFSLGIVGLYIGKMFEQTKQRPIFVIDKKINV